MKAIILAAGLGKRMRPLTDTNPKPLLRAGGKRLIDFHLEALSSAGIQDVVINTHWLAEQLPESLGDGRKWGLSIKYSHEHELLETAGGIKQALDLLQVDNDDAFLVVNGDVYCELNINEWISSAIEDLGSKRVFLNLVPNPEHNPKGDFAFNDDQKTLSKLSTENTDRPTYTYSGIALFRPSFFDQVPDGKQALAPFLFHEIASHSISASVCQDYWSDIGTPERLDALNTRLSIN